MAATATVRRNSIPGDARRLIVDVVPSNSYPTGGEVMTPALFGLSQVYAVVPLGDLIGGTAVSWTYDRANNKLKASVMATGAEVANATDLSGHTVTCEVLGI